MANDETVELPKDRKGQTLHIGDEVLAYSYNREPIAQYGATMSCNKEYWECRYDYWFGAGFNDVH